MRGEALWILSLVLLADLRNLLHLLAYRSQPDAKTQQSSVLLSLVLVIILLCRLASMGIVFALEHFIYEPLLALLFGDREFVRNRGGFFYNFKLGEDYRAAQAL